MSTETAAATDAGASAKPGAAASGSDVAPETRWTVGRIVRTALFAAVALIALAAVVVPMITASTTFTITGRSMEPSIPLGSLIVTRPVAADEVRIGDVVTYQLESGRPAVATHRVVGIQFADDGPRFITKGDANDIADAEPVLPEQLRGRLWYTLPLIGWVNAVVTGELRAWMLPAVVVALCGYAGWMFVGAFRDRRTRTRGAGPEV